MVTSPMADSVSDSDLLMRWGQGDTQAADELIRRHYDGILRFFQLKLSQQAEDLTQRTFLACVEARSRFRHDASFRSFLFGVARKELLKFLESRARFARLVRFHDEQRPQSVLSPSGVVAKREEQHLLLRALDEIPTEMQICLQLFYIDAMRTQEIADALEISQSGVTTRLARAREELRKQVLQLGRSDAIQESLVSNLEGWAWSLGGHPPGSQPAGQGEGPA
jgi:RNA polymerase sigma-70 factor (ECF subfamily)